MLFCIDCVCILISQRIDFTRNSCLLICAPRYLLFLLRLSLRFLSLSLFLPANVKFLPSHQKECNSRIKNSDVSRCFPERFLSFPLCSSLSSSLVSFCYFIFVCTNWRYLANVYSLNGQIGWYVHVVLLLIIWIACIPWIVFHMLSHTLNNIIRLCSSSISAVLYSFIWICIVPLGFCAAFGELHFVLIYSIRINRDTTAMHR